MKRLAFPLILALIVAGLIAIFTIGNGGNDQAEPRDRLGTLHEDQGRGHIEVATEHDPYNSSPASSGPHYDTPAPWGIKDNEVIDEIFVHNLEHGGIVITYRPDLPAEQLEELKQAFGQLPPSPQFNNVKAILTPRSKNERPISLAAWRYTYDMDTVNAEDIIKFYEDHIDQGPELVP
jgi:hypothetical protein